MKQTEKTTAEWKYEQRKMKWIRDEMLSVLQYGVVS